MRGGEDFDLVEAEADEGEGWVGEEAKDGGGFRSTHHRNGQMDLTTVEGFDL